jgi:chitinase
MKPIRRIAVAAAAALLTAGGAVGITLAAAGNAQAATSGGVKFAYFTQWGIYANATYPKSLETSGQAGKLDFIQYAFENIDPVNKTCFEANSAASQDESNPNAGDGAGDVFADYQKSYDAASSVDGVADVWNQPIAGNFNQLKKLKAKHPNLKILVSIGGWTYSKYFSDVAASDAARKKFVTSCVDMFIKGNLPALGGFGGPGTGAGVFDGIDIDWEYPGSPGGHTGNHYTAADKQNFTLLLAELRSQLDAYGASVGKKLYLTAAVPAGQDKIQYIETNKVGQYLDYANAMTYDMHGAWETTTNLQDPLYSSPSDPFTVGTSGQKYSVDAAVTAWTTGDSAFGIPGGFPAGKLVLGYPLYYRGWAGVPAGQKHGLYQSATSGATGHALSGNVAGVSFYKELTGFVDNPAYTYYDTQAQAAYFYDGSTLWSGDNAQSIKAKTDYAHCKGLAGAMLYSMEALDSAGTLFNAVINGVNASTAGCTGPSTPPTSASASKSASASPSVSRSASASPSSSAGGCVGVAAWSAATAYTGGAVVSYNGHKWTAKWWTQGETPGNNSSGVWTDSGACTGGTTTPTGGTGQCAGLAAWSATNVYVGGNVVSYGGHKWTAKWWTQGDTPGGQANVWTDNGAC